MDQSILRVLQYFEQFEYPPSLYELKIFNGKKISIHTLKEALRELEKKGAIYRNNDRFTRHNKLFHQYSNKRKHSIQYFRKIINALSWTAQIPSIQFVGVSGSLSMLNMTQKGDIDLFVITKSHSIWQTRFILLVYKYLLKVLDPDIGRKLCFNLFFSEGGLKIAKNKQNEYIGHEILQLKAIVNKNNIYERFLLQNEWILKIFPNVQISSKHNVSTNRSSPFPYLSAILEKILEKIQIWWLSRKNIRWDYGRGQLWLIQDDFEKKIKKVM